MKLTHTDESSYINAEILTNISSKLIYDTLAALLVQLYKRPASAGVFLLSDFYK